MAPHDIPLDTYGPTAGRRHVDGKAPRPKTVTVDLHNHMRILAADELVRPHLPENHHVGMRNANSLTREIYAKQFGNRAREWTEVDKRLEDMDAMDLDVMAVSCAPPQFYYVVEPSLGQESSQIINDGIAANIKGHPDRFVGLATVPLQDTDLAVKELKRAVNELGFRGVQTGARVNNEELSAERFEPFWATVEELDVPVFIHPSSFATDRFGFHYLSNVIGNPLDTTVAVHYLIFDGVMERYPKLKIFLSHGGGFAGSYAARMDHAYGARADCRTRIEKKPSTYLKQFYFDSIVFAVDQLAFLIGKYGADHVLIGTDYPADMGEYSPVEHVYQVEGLSEGDREKVCGLNALRLMGLEESRFRR